MFCVNRSPSPIILPTVGHLGSQGNDLHHFIALTSCELDSNYDGLLDRYSGAYHKVGLELSIVGGIGSGRCDGSTNPRSQLRNIGWSREVLKPIQRRCYPIHMLLLAKEIIVLKGRRSPRRVFQFKEAPYPTGHIETHSSSINLIAISDRGIIFIARTGSEKTVTDIHVTWHHPYEKEAAPCSLLRSICPCASKHP
uniref:MMS1_N domain-containing protein n=1 Tax=Heterorhabditis bacteriophora TaxID=37862 RepID=A0A1I7XRU6_HETBA